MPVSDWVLKDREGLIKAGKEITVSTMQDMVFKPFTGKTDMSIIKTSDEFPTETSVAKIRLRGRLTGTGAADNTNASTNRDKMKSLYQNISYEHFANSVESDDKTPIRNKSAAAAFFKDAKEELTEWAKARLTNIQIGRLSENCTNIVACKSDGFYEGKTGGLVNTSSSIKAGDILNTLAISEAVKRAKTGYDNAGNRHPKIRPFVVKPNQTMGVNKPLEFYLMALDHTSAEQLKNDPVYLEFQKHAQVKGLLNNVFTGALGMYDGVIFYDMNNRDDEENYAGIYTSAMGDYLHYAGGFDIYAGTSDRETSINLLLGATAGLMPLQKTGMDYWEGGYDEDEKGIARISWGISFQKTKFQGLLPHEKQSIFHNKDYGVTAIVCSKE